jgi:PhnB protein
MLISILPVNPEGDRGWRKEGNDMTVQPYLFFEGRCEEAIEFYKDAVGAEVLMLLRFRDCPQPAPPGMAAPDPEEVMHASLRIGGTEVLASDGRCSGTAAFGGFALSLAVPDEAAAEARFAALLEGGQVVMPLARTFYSPRFGMVRDRFGVLWMVIVPA